MNLERLSLLPEHLDPVSEHLDPLAEHLDPIQEPKKPIMFLGFFNQTQRNPTEYQETSLETHPLLLSDWLTAGPLAPPLSPSNVRTEETYHVFRFFKKKPKKPNGKAKNVLRNTPLVLSDWLTDWLTGLFLPFSRPL